MTAGERELRARLRTACCPFSGLTAKQLDAHVEAVASMVEAAREREGDRLEYEVRRALDRHRHAMTKTAAAR